ncbi:SprT family zinc-dependent metalloprotease [Ignavibacteriales bacterium]
MKPSADRLEVVIAGHKLLCSVRRSRRAKIVAIRINQTGLFELVIPERGSFEEARNFLESKRKFLERHIHLLVHKKEESPYKLFGEDIKVEHHYNLFLRKHVINFNKETSELTIESPQGAKETTLELYRGFLNGTAAKYLIPRTQHLAARHGFNPSMVRVKKMRGKWGFCTIKKEIFLSPLLMSLEPELIDYVIIHELCHLKQMNHSELFYAELKKILPNYAELRKRIQGKKV